MKSAPRKSSKTMGFNAKNSGKLVWKWFTTQSKQNPARVTFQTNRSNCPTYIKAITDKMREVLKNNEVRVVCIVQTTIGGYLGLKRGDTERAGCANLVIRLLGIPEEPIKSAYLKINGPSRGKNWFSNNNETSGSPREFQEDFHHY